MTTTNERVAILETKVDAIKEDVQGLQASIANSHTGLVNEITAMKEQNRQEHLRVITVLDSLKDFKTKILVAIAIIGPVLAYALAHVDIKKFLA